MQSIKDIKRIAKWSNEVKEQAKAEKAIDFLENNQADYMLEHYNKIYQTQNKKDAMRLNHKEFNLTEQLISELAICFRNGIDVEVIDKDQEDKSENAIKKEEILNDIIKNSLLLPTLKQID